MIDIEGLTHRYAGSSAAALRIDHWSVATNGQPQSGCVLGPSGCGKTTLLSILAGLVIPTQGRVQVAGADFSASSRIGPSERDQVRASRIGIVTQVPHFARPLNMRDNLLLAMQLAGKGDRRTNEVRVEQTVKQLKIEHRLLAKPYQLSVGEAQRFAVARAVLHGPKLVLADEPTSALDDESAQNVVTLLRTQTELIGASLVVVTHDSRVSQALPVLLRLERAMLEAQA
jgi:ABC-type lipoprotein export system ATPase subunit